MDSAIANASWRPANQMPSATIVATIMVSAPMPNISRPAAISANGVPIAVRAAPARQITEVQNVTGPGP